MVGFFKQLNISLIKSFLLLVIVLLASCSKEQKNQPIIMNMYYHDARNLILQSGWKPADGMPPYDQIGVDAQYLRDLGYAEVSDCTGGGMSACLLYFQNEAGEYLKIGTSGEYPDPHYKFQTKVIYAAVQDQID